MTTHSGSMMYTSFLTSSEDDRRQVRGYHPHPHQQQQQQQQQSLYPQQQQSLYPQQQQSLYQGSNVSDEESQWDLEGVPMTRRGMDAGTPSYLLSIQEEEDLSFYNSQQRADVGAGVGGSSSYYQPSFTTDGRRGRRRRRKPNLHIQGTLREWTRRELIFYIIRRPYFRDDPPYGPYFRNLRNENMLSDRVLREMVSQLCLDDDDPLEKPQMPFFDQQQSMALLILNWWIKCRVKQIDTAVALRAMMNDSRSDDGYMEEDDDKDLLGGALRGSSAPDFGQDEEKQLYLMACYDSAVMREGVDQQSSSGKEEEDKHISRRPTRSILDEPWEAPDVKTALRFADYMHPRKGGKGGRKFDFCGTHTGRHCCKGTVGEQFDIFEEGQVSEFSIYGSGVTNYFKFIKWGFWLMLILTIVSIPVLIVNVEGPNESNNKGLQELARTTAGNLVSQNPDQSVSLPIPLCPGYSLDGSSLDCRLDRSSLSSYYMFIDIVIVSIAFVAFLWLRKFQKIEERNLEKNTVNASVYTVAVTNLPPQCSELELKRHFVRMLVQSGQGSISKIASVSLAFNNTNEILESMRRGDIIREKIKAVHKFRRDRTVVDETMDHDPRGAADRVGSLRTQFDESMIRFNEDLRRAEDNLDRLGQAISEPLYAFVTFDRVAGKEALIAQYNSFSGLYRMLYPTELDLRGSKMVVRQATEPSTIIWENLAFSTKERFQRTLATTALALLLVSMSLVAIFAARYLQLKIGDDTFDSQVLTYFASLIVVAVNQLMEYLLKSVVYFEKHHTEDGKSRSIFFRLFVLKYINTSLVFFINNNSDILGRVFGITAPTRRDVFTADWFNNVGVTLMLVHLGDIFLSHGFKCFQYFYFLFQRSTGTYLSQDELNRSYVGPSFELAFKYAQLMSTFFGCFTFSTGIPILYAFSAANFGLYYLVEKFLFIRLYRIPPHFSNIVGVFATSLVPYALVIHLGMSIWVLSDKGIFDSDSSVTVTLVVLLLLLSMSVVAAWIFSVFSKQIMKVWRSWCGVSRWKTASDAKPIHAHVSFTRAVQRNLIKGLSTYNILQNPAYKEAFAITWKFAMDHSTVRQVRKMKVRAGQANDDIDPDLAEIMPLSVIEEDTYPPADDEDDGDDAGRPMNRPVSAGVHTRSFVDSFLAPAASAADQQHPLRNTRLPDPRPTPRSTPIPAPHRSPAAVTSLHPAPSQDLMMRDLQPLDRDDDDHNNDHKDDDHHVDHHYDHIKIEQKSSDPVAVAIEVTNDRNTRYRDTPPLAMVRQARSRIHVPAHIPLPPVRLPPTINQRQQQRQQQQQDGWESFDHLLY